MPQTCGNLVVHLIFSTKQRLPLITSEIRADLFAYLGGIIHEMRGTAAIVNGTADHVHVLARLRPAHSPAEIVRVIKTNSSRWLHEKGHPEFAWQAGYGAFSVSESNVDAVIRYIADQEAHHQKHSFQDEFVAFLKKNNVDYDPRYIWD
jgi:REP element-mobilizing transposase RayT